MTNELTIEAVAYVDQETDEIVMDISSDATTGVTEHRVAIDEIVDIDDAEVTEDWKIRGRRGSIFINVDVPESLIPDDVER